MQQDMLGFKHFWRLTKIHEQKKKKKKKQVENDSVYY